MLIYYQDSNFDITFSNLCTNIASVTLIFLKDLNLLLKDLIRLNCRSCGWVLN